MNRRPSGEKITARPKLFTGKLHTTQFSSPFSLLPFGPNEIQKVLNDKISLQKKMNLKLSLVLLFSAIKVFGQNLDTIINEKIHLTEEDAEGTNLSPSGEEESDRVKSPYSSSYQQTLADQQAAEVQQPQQQQQQIAEVQTKKIHTGAYPPRPMFSNPNSISKTNPTAHVLSKPRPSIAHSHSTFSEMDNQQQQVMQQFDNDMENSFVAFQQSTSPPFSVLDAQRDNNWPFSSGSNAITSKPSGEFTVNSNTLNFTSQGMDNLKTFNITSTNHVLPPITFTSIVPNYNQQDPLSPMQIIANPIQNLVLRSFESFRRLIKNCESIENFLITKMNLPKWSKLHRLDPLELPESLYFEHRDPKTPLLGKLKFTLENVLINGLSTFKTENLSNQGRTLYFKHRIPQLDFLANYTVDYHLFDEIPLLISKGHLKATVPNAYIKGSFIVLPDILNVWFKIANLNLSSSVDDVDVKVQSMFAISDRFRIERSTLNKLSAVIKNIMPNIIEYLKLTYSKAIEMKIV